MSITEEDGAVATALANPPKWDLVGPTAEDDIHRAIGRYGVDAVQAAVKKLARPKRGRPKINDWRELHEVIEADARDWLAGRNPIAARSNYSIAKEFAEKNPGQSAVSTHQRIERKLARKPYDRRWYMLVFAEQMSRDGYPHGVHLRTLEELSKTDLHPVWADIVRYAKSDIADYEAKHGKPPAANLSMKEVQDAARNALLAFSPPKRKGGLFGLLSPHVSTGSGGE